MPRQPERRNTAIKAHDDAHLSTATEATNRVQGLALLSLKRTFDLFMENLGQYVPLDEESQKLKLTCKVRDEYGQIQGFVSKTAATAKPAVSQPEVVSDMAKLIDSIPAEGTRHQEMNLENKEKQLIVQSEGKPGITAVAKEALSSTVMVPTATGGQKEYTPSATIARRAAAKWPRPQWRAPWKAYRVISGHQGWVRSVAFDPSNDWFATGSGDRTIKIWDVASGTLKLTLTGHIEQVTGLSISNRHPYMFSCALDKQVKCWDLEVNKVIRHYHGHLSGIYSIALHPTLDIIATGGRDATCRVWDMRTRTQIFALGGHEDTVAAILTQGTDPQIVTGSYDKTIKLWDLRAGKTMSTLTYHKKAVRGLAAHPTEHTFMSGAADNIKKFGLPNGEFLHNFLDQQKAIVNCVAVNDDGVAVSGGDNGSLWFWDYKSGHCFQRGESLPQPGSLDAEAGIYACGFDMTGSRLVTCEADKTIKMWKEDERATPDMYPLDFRPPKDIKRF